MEEYRAGGPAWWLAFAAKASIDGDLAPLDLIIVNTTDRNFADVEVVVTLPEGVEAFRPESYLPSAAGAPERPPAWGSTALTALSSGALRGVIPATLGQRRTVIEVRDGHDTVIFAPVDVRPNTPVTLPNIALVVPGACAGRVISLSWALTSTAADGRAQGEVTFEVGSDLATVVPVDDNDF